jgi:hypothetical protein
VNVFPKANKDKTHKKKSLLLRRQRLGASGFKASPGQKVSKTPSKPINWGWWCIPVIPAEVGGSRSEASPGKNARPYLKNNQKNRLGVTQISKKS